MLTQCRDPASLAWADVLPARLPYFEQQADAAATLTVRLARVLLAVRSCWCAQQKNKPHSLSRCRPRRRRGGPLSANRRAEEASWKRQERIVSSVLEAPSPVRAALLSAHPDRILDLRPGTEVTCRLDTLSADGWWCGRGGGGGAGGAAAGGGGGADFPGGVRTAADGLHPAARRLCGCCHTQCGGGGVQARVCPRGGRCGGAWLFRRAGAAIAVARGVRRPTRPAQLRRAPGAKVVPQSADGVPGGESSPSLPTPVNLSRATLCPPQFLSAFGGQGKPWEAKHLCIQAQNQRPPLGNCGGEIVVRGCDIPTPRRRRRSRQTPICDQHRLALS